MNKWSTSLPSIISLCNDVQFNFDPMIMQQTGTAPPLSSSNRDLHSGSESVADLSILIQTQPSFINYDQYSNNYCQSTNQTTSFYDTSIEHQTTIRTNIPTHEQFVPDDELLQSLVAYADSFDFDTSVYSIQNTKYQSATVQSPLRRRTQSSTTNLTSVIENDPLARHKSCDDISIACSATSSSKPTTVVRREEHLTKKTSTKFVPSESHPQFLFASKTNEDNHKHKNIVERNHQQKLIEESTTTTTDESKLEWGFSSDTMNELNKPLAEVFSNYEATTNIGDINLHYLKDLERFSSMAASMEFSPENPAPIPPPPVIIRKKNKDLRLRQQVDIQLLRPPTPPQSAPIIIREVRHKPPRSNKPSTIHQKLENTGQICLSKTPPPIVLRERPPLRPKHEFFSKPTIVYRHLPTPPPSPPTVIVERLRPHVPAFIQKPAPILVEKWLPYPPEQKRKIIYERASPLPIRNKRHANEQAKEIVVEYDKINVILNKDINQRKEIKRVSPNQYVQQYGNSLYSNETLNQLLMNVTCASQVKNDHPILSHQHRYEDYSPMFH